jgi:hypothetical protein
MKYDGTDPSLASGWTHEDGTECPEYLGTPGEQYWCTSHQQNVRILGYRKELSLWSDKEMYSAVPQPAGVDGLAAGAVRVICSGYQEDALMVQLKVEGGDTASLDNMVPLTPRAARLIARHLLEAADMAEDNDWTAGDER